LFESLSDCERDSENDRAPGNWSEKVRYQCAGVGSDGHLTSYGEEKVRRASSLIPSFLRVESGGEPVECVHELLERQAQAVADFLQQLFRCTVNLACSRTNSLPEIACKTWGVLMLK
jgi:hypothetical protein